MKSLAGFVFYCIFLFLSDPPSSQSFQFHSSIHSKSLISSYSKRIFYQSSETVVTNHNFDERRRSHSFSSSYSSFALFAKRKRKRLFPITTPSISLSKSSSKSASSSSSIAPTPLSPKNTTYGSFPIVIDEIKPYPLKFPDQFYNKLSPEQQQEYPIEILKYRFKEDPLLEKALETSLIAANERGKAYLTTRLYRILEWPVTSKDYLKYLKRFFIDFLPFPLLMSSHTLLAKKLGMNHYQQYQTHYFPKTWTFSCNGFKQELLDRLIHFYFLIDQPFSLEDLLLSSNTTSSTSSPVSSSSSSLLLKGSKIKDREKVKGKENGTGKDQPIGTAAATTVEKKKRKLIEEFPWFRDWILTVIPTWGNQFNLPTSFPFNQQQQIIKDLLTHDEKRKKRMLINTLSELDCLYNLKDSLAYQENIDPENGNYDNDNPENHLSQWKRSEKGQGLSPFTAFANRWKNYYWKDSYFHKKKDHDLSEIREKFHLEKKTFYPISNNNPSGWLTYNQFLTREINPSLRLIHEPFSNGLINSVADSRYMKKYYLDHDFNLNPIASYFHSTLKENNDGDNTFIRIEPRNDQPREENNDNKQEGGNNTNEESKLDQTDLHTSTFHKIRKLIDLMPESLLRTNFNGAIITHHQIDPYSSHNLHAPVTGIVKEHFSVVEKTHYDIGIQESTGNFQLIYKTNKTNSGYPIYFTKGVTTFQTKNLPFGDIGNVAVATYAFGCNGLSSTHFDGLTEGFLYKGQKYATVGYSCFDYFMIFQSRSDPAIHGIPGTLHLHSQALGSIRTKSYPFASKGLNTTDSKLHLVVDSEKIY